MYYSSRTLSPQDRPQVILVKLPGISSGSVRKISTKTLYHGNNASLCINIIGVLFIIKFNHNFHVLFGGDIPQGISTVKMPWFEVDFSNMLLMEVKEL